jgi:hypothetical protein
MGIMFTAGPVDNDFMYEIVLRFAKKEKWVRLDKRFSRYYLTDKGYNIIKYYIGGDNEQIRK